MTRLPPLPRRRPRTLALELVDGLGGHIRDGRFKPGDRLPTEAAIMAEYGVSRTVVREALSKLQASGLVATRHGVGSFVEALAPVGGEGQQGAEAAGFRIDPAHCATLQDVVAVLELRIGVETEAAGLAAQRRGEADLLALRQALDAMSAALEAGDDAVAADFEFHLAITRATQNPHFLQLMSTLGPRVIPRARLAVARVAGEPPAAERLAYLRRVQSEHESILDAIVGQDAAAARAAMRTHLANSRERRRKAALLLAQGA